MTAVAALSEPLGSRPIIVRRAPRRDPPFDDELPTAAHLVLVDGGIQPRLPFTQEQSLPIRPPPPRHASLGMPPGVPPAARFGRTLVQGIVEVLNGLRPATQLRGHMAPGVLAALVRQSAALTRFRTGGRPPTVRSVHVSEPGTGAAEITSIVDVGGRCRAIAARIEIAHGRWRCVQLQLG
jgi:Family of unknown function (DUF6459)